MDCLPSSEPLLTGIQARDQVPQRGLLERSALRVNRLFGLYSSCISHVSVPNPDLEISGGGHPDPEIRGEGRSPKYVFRAFGSQSASQPFLVSSRNAPFVGGALRDDTKNAV